MLRYKKDFHFIGGFAPDASMDRSDIFHRIDPFVTSSRWVIIAGDWNVVLDPNLDSGSIRMVQTFLRLQFIFFCNFNGILELVDKFRIDNLRREEWI